MSDRFCLDCGEKLRGRSDKKFCSDHCRNNFNNKINKDVNSFVRNVHTLLRKNRKILSDLYSTGKKQIHMDALIVSGFSFSFITQVIESGDGSVSMYCFEFGYREMGNGYIELIENKSLVVD